MHTTFHIGGRSRRGRHNSDSNEARLLSRVVRLTGEGVLVEADPQHVELLARSLGL